MYSAPDFVKVSVKAKDIFSGYEEHCPMDMLVQTNHTVPCSDSDPNYTVFTITYVGEGIGYQCYSTYNP